jgi:hypothetical protein
VAVSTHNDEIGSTVCGMGQDCVGDGPECIRIIVERALTGPSDCRRGQARWTPRSELKHPRLAVDVGESVKAYLKRNKNDAADAAAICEAARRPTMRFVRIKTAEQQGQLMQHRTRDLLMRQRTQLINALRVHLAELGIVAAQGDKGLEELLAIVPDDRDQRLPVDGRASVIVLAAQLEALQKMIGSLEKRIKMQPTL